MLPWHRNLLLYSMPWIYGAQCIQPTQYNPPHFLDIGTFMVLDVANQLNTTHRASLALGPFRHFRGVGPTPGIHGVGILYNPLHFRGVGTFYRTRCSQPARSNLPHFCSVWTSPHFHDIGIFYGSCCSQSAQYNPSGFHSEGCCIVLDAANQLGTTLRTSTT